ncbi:MAG: hypothetical protein M1282_08640 [Chloroflexi bacterium]|nr:hypothetical protein [Chloroflexota bacterium]
MNLLKRIKPLLSNPLAVPFALLVVTALAYGLSFWRLGFYWDDLPISWIRYQIGSAATVKYFSDSRPVWALLYQLTGYLLPQNPVYWQLFALFWRYVCVLAFWLVMERLFPQRKDLALFLSLLVLLYPGFNQQWVSFVYSHFFIVLFFLLFSWLLMLHKKTIPAMIFSALNLLMFEYFFMLEFIRPLIIFKSLQDEALTKRERYIKTFKLWLPYIGIVMFSVLYRLLVYTHPGFGYSLSDELARQPVATFTQLVLHILSSLWVSAGAAWLQAFQFPNLNISGARTTISYAVVVLVVGALAFFLVRRWNDNQTKPNNKHDALWLVSLGAILLVLGGVPFWEANVPVSLGFPANRATLSFMLGACFFLMGLIELLPMRVKYPVALLFVSLSAGRQFLWSVDFMRDWQSQKNLFWQMIWRAPGLEPGTMVLMNQELEYYADNSLGAALNWIYAPNLHSYQIPYVLFYPTNRIAGSLPRLEPGLPILYHYWIGDFRGNTSQTLAFYYQPPGCLRLLDPEIDADNHLIPNESLMRDAARLSSSEWITPNQTGIMPQIYGPEPAHGWCYYFEQADLARQMGDWSRVVQLGDEAFRLNDYPNDPVERFVFVEGYSQEGNWTRAKELAIQSYKVSPHYVGPLLCKLLDRMDRETPASNDKQSSLNELRTKFSCLP